ncbi:MAG: hypothetical protein IBX55_00555 [Methyloprofundus sp.]|nr:hypothetical protein [Methyloprofundus sp.]
MMYIDEYALLNTLELKSIDLGGYEIVGRSRTPHSSEVGFQITLAEFSSHRLAQKYIEKVRSSEGFIKLGESMSSSFEPYKLLEEGIVSFNTRGSKDDFTRVSEPLVLIMKDANDDRFVTEGRIVSQNNSCFFTDKDFCELGDDTQYGWVEEIISVSAIIEAMELEHVDELGELIESRNDDEDDCSFSMS